MNSDDHFGPHRANTFDFTILFEQSILSLLPTGLFLLLVPLRLFLLRNNEKVSKIGTILWLKLAALGCYACLQIALVVLWSRANPTKTAIAESALGIVESVALASLIWVEHISSRKPSKLISGYLAITVVLDIALVRTFWIRSMWAIAAVFTASFAFKIVLLILEEIPKSSTGEKTPETSSGVVNRSFFWWLNNLFLQGHRGILETEDLQAIDSKFDTNHVTGRLEEQWEKDPKNGQFSLLKCTFLAYKWQFVAGIFPRLLRSGFNFAQPFLIQSVIVFVGRKEMSVQISSGLIGATLLIYLGLAISGAWYKHLSFQMVTMYRGGLVSLIFKKTLKLKTMSVKDSAPVTLMTTDVETVVAAGSSIHDMWASLLELSVGIYLLYRQVGHPSLLVLVPTLITTILSGIISPAMEPATIQWNEMVQRRVGETSSMLDQIKGIKMMGLTDFFVHTVQGLRVQELKVSARFRWLLVHFTTLAMVSAQVTPVVVILSAIYWSKSDGGLSVAEAFTSLSLVSLVTQPLVMLLVSLMQIAGVMAGCGRIQAFLLLKEQDKMATEDPGNGLAVTVEDASFHTDDGRTLLTDINLRVPRGSISMVVGKVGSGKSSLLKAIIGENLPSKGSVKSETFPAYCDQVPWLRNTTIGKNIIGHSELDEKWLSTVIQSCALEEDLAQLPHGRETIVGSGGVALSGGQKQRVALARAVYSRNSLAVLDDVFSSLDKTTADTVFHQLLGENGLLRASTVILTTSNVYYLPFANYITVIEDGHITRNQVTHAEFEPSEALKTITPAETPEAVPKSIVKLELKKEIDLARKTGDAECYKIYVRSMGWKVISIVFPASVVGAVLEVMPQIWLRIWTEQGEGSKDAKYAGGYVGLAISSMILALLNIDYFLIVGVERSSNNLHEQLLNTVCRAPLYFFTTTENGSILNRFSQDMTLIDMSLPLAFYLTLDLTLRGLIQTGVVASGANYYGAFLPLSFLALYLIQKYYLRTSRQMRLLDLEAKTPLYTQFAEITAGLSTVRSFDWTKALLNESFELLNTSQKPFYLMFCIQRWLELVLDLFVAGMAVLLVTIALRIPGTTSEGAIGLAMVNLLGLNLTLTTVIDQWTTLETSLGAIARLKAFIGSTPNENKEMETEMPDNWPGGRIEIEKITSSYSMESKPVLHDVSLVVQPGQKVCLCGRSGSGKSSLVLSILRLLELQSGTIRIDGQDLATMSRQYIRSQVLTIPQDPVSLSGTVRKNLDPEELVQADEILIQALKKTTLWPTIEVRGGLDADLSALGFSVGQRQLFCLARALLSHSTIVLLDEPTSSVDTQTDMEVRSIIQEVMHGRTVIEVTHRLDHITDFDIAVVMEKGKIIETGEPRELLAHESALKALRG